jgi:hypothetical protein
MLHIAIISIYLFGGPEKMGSPRAASPDGGGTAMVWTLNARSPVRDTVQGKSREYSLKIFYLQRRKARHHQSSVNS